jgi:hypothetical protein
VIDEFLVGERLVSGCVALFVVFFSAFSHVCGFSDWSRFPLSQEEKKREREKLSKCKRSGGEDVWSGKNFQLSSRYDQWRK